MNPIRIISFFAFLLLSSSLMGQSADLWAIKKQRKNTGQQPSFSYQTRSGANPSSRMKTSSATSPLARQLRLATSPFTLKGPADEPPREIKGTLPEEARANGRSTTGLLGAAEVYLQEVSSLMQIQTPEEEFKLKEQFKDKSGVQHLRMQQQYKGVKVYGSEIIVHADQSNVVQGLNGRYIGSPYALNTTPSIQKEAAIQTSLDFFRKSGSLHELKPEQKQLLRYDEPAAELVILPSWLAEKPSLVWRVVVRPNILDHWEMFVDAQTGKLIEQTNMTCTFAPLLNHPDPIEKHAHAHHQHARTPAKAFRLMAPGQGNGLDLNGVDQPLNIWQLGEVSGLIDGSKDMFTGNANTEIADLEGDHYL
ncbi:hypothetical protein PZB72_25190 [Catalinimonas niigatensis]|nr:hypothetical protein [Catalinimonas niigatensis]WPP49962.1 hypothetical protein PZB72_25190 [Catalinimonas niigatensis]